MQDGMYSALFGALTCEHRLDIIANNLANADTSGYKQDRTAFEDVFVEFAHDKIFQPKLSLRDKPLFPPPTEVSKVRVAEISTDFSQGALKQTGNPLDVAIVGEGFFKVRTPDGDFFSRDGSFVLSPEGILMTPQGFPVLGGGGEIAIPEGKQIEIDGGGNVFVDHVQVGQLDVSTVSDPKAMQKFGRNLYFLPEDAEAVEQELESIQVSQGYLEASNINVVEEMVNMIETQRAFEAYQKVIKGVDEMDREAISRVAKAT